MKELTIQQSIYPMCVQYNTYVHKGQQKTGFEGDVEDKILVIFGYFIYVFIYF